RAGIGRRGRAPRTAIGIHGIIGAGSSRGGVVAEKLAPRRPDNPYRGRTVTILAPKRPCVAGSWSAAGARAGGPRTLAADALGTGDRAMGGGVRRPVDGDRRRADHVRRTRWRAAAADERGAGEGHGTGPRPVLP